MGSILRPICLAAVAVSVCVAPAQVKLRLNMKPGAAFKYKVTMDMTQSGMMDGSVSTTATATIKVNSLRNGVYDMSISSGKTKVSKATGLMASAKEQIEKMSNETTFSAKYDSRGRTQGMTSAGGAAQMQAMGSALGNAGIGFMGVEFPDGPVRVGSTWQKTIDFGQLMGGMTPGISSSSKIPIVYKVTAIKGNKVTISMSMKGTADMSSPQGNIKMKTSTTGSYVVDSTNGSVITFSSKGTNDIDAANFKMKQVMSSKGTRI